jgi:predicted small secreted protein
MAYALPFIMTGLERGNNHANLTQSFSTLLIACSLAAILGSFGCNTVHGMGQDIERAGEKTEDAADAVKRRL